MRIPIDEMMTRDIDIEIAECLGWTNIKPGSEYRVWDRPLGGSVTILGIPPTEQQYTSGYRVPSYSSDLNKAITLGDESVKLGISARYLRALRIVARERCADVLPRASGDTRIEWVLLHADAMTRAKAFLTAWRETDDNR